MEDKRLQWADKITLDRIKLIHPKVREVDLNSIPSEWKNVKGVYMIVSPSNKIYVGSTINILNRFRAYRRLKCKGQIKLYNSFKKYGVNLHKFYVLCILDCDSLLLRKEAEVGIYYNTLNNGLNCRLPKVSDEFISMSLETRIKISQMHKGKKLTKEQKLNISEVHRGKKLSKSHVETIKRANKGRVFSKEHRMKISEANRKRVISESTKDKLRKAQTGRKHSEEHKRKVSENNAKNLAKMVIDMSTGIIFESAKEASEAFNIKHSTLRARLNGNSRNKTNLIYIE